MRNISNELLSFWKICSKAILKIKFKNRFKEQDLLNVTQSEKHIVTPHNDPEQSVYFCKGVRDGRPSYSKKSDALKTKNLREYEEDVQDY